MSNPKKDKHESDLEKCFLEFSSRRAAWLAQDKTEHEEQILTDIKEMLADQDQTGPIQEDLLMHCIYEIAQINAVKGYSLGFMEARELREVLRIRLEAAKKNKHG